MKNKIVRIIFFISMGLIVSALSYGLSELYENATYSTGYEISMVFIIGVLVLFTYKEIASLDFLSAENSVKTLQLYLYKYFAWFYGVVIVMAGIIVVVNYNAFTYGLLPFFFPIISIFLMIDVIITLYLNDAVKKVGHKATFKMQPQVINVIVIPIFITSLTAVIGTRLSLDLWVWAMTLIVVTLAIKVFVLKRFTHTNEQTL